MHKAHLSPNSPTSYSDILNFAKMISREKSREGRPCSRSPKQADQHQHLKAERRAETEQYRQLQERYLELECKYR